MNRESLDCWCERGILALVLGVLVFSPVAMGAARLQEFLVVQFLTLLALLLWVVRVWVCERPKFLLPPMSWAALTFSGYAIARYFGADVEYVAREEVLRVLVYTSLFFLVLNNLHRQESTQIIGFTMFAVATAVSFYALYQFVTKSDLVFGYHTSYKGRGSGTFVCPNHLGGFLEMLLPLALAYAFVGRGKPLTKIIIGYTALVMVMGIAVTVSRGTAIAAGFGLAFMAVLLLMQRPFRIHGLILLAGLFLGGFLAAINSNFFQQRFKLALSPDRLDLNIRMDMWDSAYRMWRDKPWLGVGPAHFDELFRIYRPADVQLQADRVHNDYLNTLTDWGIAGSAIIVIALGMLTVGVIKVWRHVQRADRAFSSNTSDKFAFVLGASCGVIAILLHSLVDFNMHIPANAILAVTLMALLTSHWRFATERYWVSAQAVGKIVASALLIGMITILGWQQARLTHELYWLRQARKAPDNSLERAALLEKAYAAESNNGETAQTIGEIYSVFCFEGKDDYQTHADKAIQWFKRGVANNPHNSRNYLRWGIVLDFLLLHKEAEPLFTRADELDPNGYYTCAYIGRHFLESGQLAAARPWLERSRLLWKPENIVAESNLRIANERLLEAAGDPLIHKLRERENRE
jgi:O-antigen ligase